MEKNTRFKILLSSIFVVFLLSGCSSSGEDNEIQAGSNLIDSANLIEGQWMDTDGNEQSNKNMYQSQSIGYVSSNEYIINSNAYISYFNDEAFIKTERLSGGVNDLPHTLDTVEEADEIVVSFNSEWLENIELTSNKK